MRRATAESPAVASSSARQTSEVLICDDAIAERVGSVILQCEWSGVNALVVSNVFWGRKTGWRVELESESVVWVLT